MGTTGGGWSPRGWEEPSQRNQGWMCVWSLDWGSLVGSRLGMGVVRELGKDAVRAGVRLLWTGVGGGRGSVCVCVCVCVGVCVCGQGWCGRGQSERTGCGRGQKPRCGCGRGWRGCGQRVAGLSQCTRKNLETADAGGDPGAGMCTVTAMPPLPKGCPGGPCLRGQLSLGGRRTGMGRLVGDEARAPRWLVTRSVEHKHTLSLPDLMAKWTG